MQATHFKIFLQRNQLIKLELKHELINSIDE
jgi:hypothetical protein